MTEQITTLATLTDDEILSSSDADVTPVTDDTDGDDTDTTDGDADDSDGSDADSDDSDADPV